MIKTGLGARGRKKKKKKYSSRDWVKKKKKRKKRGGGGGGGVEVDGALRKKKGEVIGDKWG